MTIGNIYDSFQSSYCYGIQKLPTIQPNEAKQAEKQNDAALEQQAVRLGTTGSQENSTSLTKEETNPASRMANLDQVALTFNKEESFEYIGNDSSLDNLDMQKAISVMRKGHICDAERPGAPGLSIFCRKFQKPDRRAAVRRWYGYFETVMLTPCKNARGFVMMG